MDIREVLSAINEAKRDIEKIERTASALASLLLGNLRNINDTNLLHQLKRELSQFDSRKKQWKN